MRVHPAIPICLFPRSLVVIGVAALLVAGDPARSAEEAADPPSGAEQREQAQQETGVAYTPKIEGVENDDLRGLLEQASQLFALEDRRPATVPALERRTQNDLERLREVLRSEGYYASKQSYQLKTDDRPIAVIIDVTPGPRFTLAAFEIEYDGTPPKEGSRPALGELDIKTGMPARAPDVKGAEAKAVAYMRDRGYPFAKADDLKATVRFDENTMSVKLFLDAGPPATLGALAITGLKTVKEDYIRRIVDWPEGEPFDQRKLNAARTALNRTGLFSSVRITPAESVEPDGALPVTMAVAESPHRTIGAGVRYSTDIGPGGDVYWEHRNIFGRNEQLRLTVTGAQIEQIGRVDFRKPAFLEREQALLASGEIANRDTDAFDQQSVGGTVSLERPLFWQWRGSAGVSASYDIIEDNDGKERVKLFGLPLNARRSTADDPLNPTRGTVLDLSATPYTGASSKVLHFLRMSAGGSAYYSIDRKSRFILAGRTRVGSIVGESASDIPADKRFYAGGGGSVRGYEFQKVGPLDSDGDPIGGRSLFEVSGELRIRLIDNFGIVPFVDGGTVTEQSYPSFDERFLWAAGLGLRYYTGFGPLRLDVAFPINGREEDDVFQFYVSFGQAF